MKKTELLKLLTSVKAGTISLDKAIEVLESSSGNRKHQRAKEISLPHKNMKEGIYWVEGNKCYLYPLVIDGCIATVYYKGLKAKRRR